MTVHDDRS